MMFARALAGLRAHSGMAAAAAATARAVSVAPSLGTVLTSSPLTGLVTSMVAPSSALTHWPPMYAWLFSRPGSL